MEKPATANVPAMIRPLCVALGLMLLACDSTTPAQGDTEGTSGTASPDEGSASGDMPTTTDTTPATSTSDPDTIFMCGECSGDADCAFGCTQPNPIPQPAEGSVCNNGGLGAGCESNAGCNGLECSLIIEVPGILAYSTCGECSADADCMPGQVCNPKLDLQGLGGAWTCVSTGALTIGEFCAADGSGAQACASGVCASGTFEGIIDFGICSECELDADCPVGQTCSTPGSDPDGTVTPATCG